MSLFSNNLGALLEREGLSQSAFARMVGGSQAQVSQVLRGVTKPPKDRKRLLRWADALRLEGQERERFLYEADLARSPATVQRTLANKGVASPVDLHTEAMNDLGDYLQELMEANGITANQLAAGIEADIKIIEQYLTGTPIPENDVDSIARFFRLEGTQRLRFRHLAEIWSTVPIGKARKNFVEILDRLIADEERLTAMRQAMGE